MSKRPREHSIAVLVIAALVGVATLLLGTLGVHNHRTERERERARLETELGLTANQLAVGLALPLWNFDRPQLDKLLDSVMENQNLYAVVVHQTDAGAPGGVTVHARVRDASWASQRTAHDVPTGSMPFETRPVTFGDERIGLLKVIATERFMAARLERSLVTLALEIGAVDLLLIVGLYVLLSRIVLKPLAALESFARDVSVGESGTGARPRRQFRGELESLRSSVERTFELLDTRYAKLLESEERLRSSEEQYRLLADNVADVIWVLGDDERLRYVSPSVTRLRGYTPEQVLGQTLAETLTPASLARIRAYLGEPARKPEDPPTILELEQTRADGSSVWAEVTLLPLFDGAGKRTATLCCSRDVSERKRAEIQRESLEQQVRQAQKLEAIGTLAGGIAHDFNNILAAIMSYAEVISMDLPKDSTLREDARGIQAAANRATALVKQILAFSRKTPHELRTIELNHLVREALGMLRATLPATVSLKISIAGSSLVVADPTEMHQVVVNLCTNAWKAMPSSGGKLEVSLEQVELDAEACSRHHGLTPGRFVCLTVKDDGCGMPAAVLERIFDPFFTTRSEGEGTGLGLAVVHGIVKRCRGAIAVTSTVGQGSTFTILLPLAEGAAAEDAREDDPLPGRERLLYVDDETELTETMQRALSRLGYRIRTLNSSPVAFGAVRDDPHAFDLIITDLTMPVLQGDQLARLIRKARSDLPIIVLTGSLQEQKPAWIDELGAAAMVSKPVSLPELTRVMRRLIDQAGPAAT